MPKYENFSQRTTIGGAAVDGLVAGLMAGAGMVLYLTGVGLVFYSTWIVVFLQQLVRLTA